MPLLVNLRHLESQSVRLRGELPMEELDIDTRDEVIRVESPLQYDLEVEKFEGGLLAQGRLAVELRCQCVRCLTVFNRLISIDHWTRHLPLEGEEPVPVVNDCVDLTPGVREDMLLEFPQHPLCAPDCRGLPNSRLGELENTSRINRPEMGSTAWDELNKLKF